MSTQIVPEGDSDVTLVEVPKATIYIERSVKVRDYESLKVAMHFPVDLPVKTLYTGDIGEFLLGPYLTDLDAALKAGFTTVKCHVFEQLGLEFEDRNGVIVEKVAASFQGAAEVQSSSRQAPNKAPAAPSADQPDACASCGGTKFYDNRERKASGQYKPNYPDFKCAEKGCGKGVWLDKKGSR